MDLKPRIKLEIEEWPLKEPFRITGHTWEKLEVLLVTVSQDGQSGQAEGAGVYYRGDAPARMYKQLTSVKGHVEAGISRPALMQLLPTGGARNALDCALWDLEAKLSGRPAWQMAKVATPRPLVTTFTCSAYEPERMAETARKFVDARAIKVKLTGDSIDAERVQAIRGVRPDVWLGVDANQGFTPATLRTLMPVLQQCDVSLIEQPFPRGKDDWLDRFESPIAIAADESVQGLSEVAPLAGRYQVLNIKLDKCGGLTEALAMARAAEALGLRIMVGNVLGTSLAMAPAYLLGQLCEIVDLDGPIFLNRDRHPAVSYEHGYIHCPQPLWGATE